MTSLIRVSDVDTLFIYTIHAYLTNPLTIPCFVVIFFMHPLTTLQAL